jgi:hypothetical protein
MRHFIFRMPNALSMAFRKDERISLACSMEVLVGNPEYGSVAL